MNYLDVDRIDNKRVRKMYVIPTAHASAEPGQEIPDGAILVMEDHNAKMNADGSLAFDAAGRLIPEDAVTNIFVMEKQSEWETDNGDWDYAWFNPDGSRKADAKFDGCFSCHAPRADRDFTFTYWKFVADRAR